MRKFLLIVFPTFLLALIFQPALAQGSAPPVDPSSAWGEVVNPDGSIRYTNLSDQGVVTDPNASWMPSIPLPGGNSIGLSAEYHVYTTPSGNSVVMPTATTLFFMAMNPQESGFSSAVSNLGVGSGGNVAAGLPAGISSAGAVFGALLNRPGASELVADMNAAGYNGPTASQDFFSALLSGEANIWSVAPDGVFNLLSDLGQQSVSDLNLYTAMLLYTPDACGGSPTGCTPEQESLITPPEETTTVPPEAPSCPSPVVIPGKITRSGAKVSPNYPIVVGQDPEKTGVTIQFSASVAPTIYRYWTLEPIEECNRKPWPLTGWDCEIVDWTCEEHTQSYPECISIASGSLRLTPESKDWIVNELSIRYPGAYVHRPTFSFPASSSCSWTYTAPRVQVEDPGEWKIYVNGQTSGTPVSAARPFGGPAGSFEAWLKETAIIK